MDFSVALSVGVLAGLGVGSGGAFVLYLTEVASMDQLTAQGTNLGVFAVALGVASLFHLHRGKLPISLLLITLFFGGIGAFLGAAFAQSADKEALRFSLGILLLFLGVLSLLPKKKTS